MRLFLRIVIVITTFMATFFFIQSCFRQKSGSSGGIPRIDRAQLCKDGGATFNESTNECDCSAGMKWSGIRCDVVTSESQTLAPSPAPAVQVPEQPVEPVVPQPPVENVAEKNPEPKEPQKQEAVDEHKVAESTANDTVVDRKFILELKRACRIGGGRYLAKEKYCHCPDGKVLMGRRCRLTYGRMTDDVCLRAVNKGSWENGICVCPEGLTFSAGHGGCVPPTETSNVIKRRICENTVNQGRWSKGSKSCTCPGGKVMIGEVCTSTTKMKSSDICEDLVYHGTWDTNKKICQCPDGKLWINQRCLSVQQVDAETACVSELNQGTWSKRTGRCICPRGRKWMASQKVCK